MKGELKHIIGVFPNSKYLFFSKQHETAVYAQIEICKREQTHTTILYGLS